MPREKKTSSTVEKAEQRLASLQSIDPTLDLGRGLTIQAFTEAIDNARRRVAAYNTTLSHLDADRVAMEDAEKIVRDLSEKMFLGVAFAYGKDSREYEMAGGVRKSQRKRPTRSKASVPVTV
jgi:hypothetical protein